MIAPTSRPGHRAEMAMDDNGILLVCDSRADLIYQFDTRKRELIKSWPARGDGAGDLALDKARHRLFVGTRIPQEMTVYDSLSGKEIQSLPGPETMDGVHYDANLKRVYMTGGRWFGIFLLIGIVKKNAIMMIDFALAAQREQGLPPDEAIRQGALLRFRPIMMTTMGAFVGAMPLAFGTGVGSELRTPLGIAIAGGLLVSQTLTLFTTPVIYLWFDRLAAVSRRRRARRTQHAGEAVTHGIR
jgi:hypothetical protein